MSEPRFTTLTPETMTADQKRVADAIQSGPRGAGVRGPFNALLRSPELCDLVQRVGAFVRFGSSIPQRLNEMAIIMAGRKWTAQYEFHAHRRLAPEAGVSTILADAIAAKERPAVESGHRSARLWSRPFGSHIAQGRPRHEVSPVRSPIYGWMFWFSRKKF